MGRILKEKKERVQEKGLYFERNTNVKAWESFNL